MTLTIKQSYHKQNIAECCYIVSREGISKTFKCQYVLYDVGKKKKSVSIFIGICKENSLLDKFTI